MARERKKRTKKTPSPEDVLAGRVKVDALELFRLIHRVNPTNRPISRQEAQRRYHEKHQLQSFLVLNYGEDHVVVSRTEKEGVVQFDHPSGVFDACHVFPYTPRLTLAPFGAGSLVYVDTLPRNPNSQANMQQRAEIWF